jgi:hypothetical protein
MSIKNGRRFHPWQEDIDPKSREKETRKLTTELQQSYLMPEYLFRKLVSYWMPFEVRMYKQHLVF